MEMKSLVDLAIEAGPLVWAMLRSTSETKKSVAELKKSNHDLRVELECLKTELTQKLSDNIRGLATLGQALLKTNGSLVRNKEEVEELRSMLTALMKFMSSMTADEKANFGKVIWKDRPPKG